MSQVISGRFRNATIKDAAQGVTDSLLRIAGQGQQTLEISRSVVTGVDAGQHREIMEAFSTQFSERAACRLIVH